MWIAALGPIAPKMWRAPEHLGDRSGNFRTRKRSSEVGASQMKTSSIQEAIVLSVARRVKCPEFLPTHAEIRCVSEGLYHPVYDGCVPHRLHTVRYINCTCMNDLTCPVPRNDNTERIFREAWELFQARGYRGASMDELCRRCGITKPTLYYYFKDKETLYLHVVLRQLQGLRAITQEQASLSDRLIRLATLVLSGFDASIAAMMRDMTHIMEPSYHQAIGQAFQEELLGPLTAAIGQAMEAGSLRQGDPDFFAWAYLGLINTFIGRKQASDADPEALARGLVALFLEGAQQTAALDGQSQPREAAHLL